MVGVKSVTNQRSRPLEAAADYRVRIPMITICHPVDDMELLFIQMELQAEAIPHLVVGQHFGSLYPGMQMPWYNERSVLVPINLVQEAQEVIRRVRAYYEPVFVNLNKKSKLRIFCEAVLFGWVVPAGNKKPSKPAFNRDAPNRRAG